MPYNVTNRKLTNKICPVEILYVVMPLFYDVNLHNGSHEMTKVLIVKLQAQTLYNDLLIITC